MDAEDSLMQKFLSLMTLTIIGIAAGCGGMGRTNWSCPGTAELQRRRAEVFDPYPQFVSSTESPGTRPRDYDRPALDPEPRNWCPRSQNVVPR